MKFIHALPLLIYISFQSVYLLYSDFHQILYDHCRMFLLIIMHTCGPYYFLSCYTLWIIIEHPCIEYLISLHKLSCILLLLLRVNHLTLCSNSNHLWYPLIVLKCKVHVSFITFILEDEHGLSLGMLMHVKCIHELCIILLIFQSYLHHIRVISLFYNDFGNIWYVSYFYGINTAQAENPISIF